MDASVSALLISVLLTITTMPCSAADVQAYFTNGGVSGRIIFSGSFSSSGGVTINTTQLNGYQQSGGSGILWHVHQFAFPTGAPDLCGAAATGGPWDPGSRMANPNYASQCVKSAWSVCSLGDLSGKIGPLSSGQFADGSTLGLLDLLGRAVVLHRSDGTRFACANIQYTESRQAPVTCSSASEPQVYWAQFVWPIAGTMLVRSYSTQAGGGGAQTPVATTVDAQLYDVTGMPSQFQGNLSWTGHEGEVGVTDTTNEAVARCFRAGNMLAGGNFSGRFRLPVTVGATPQQSRQVLSYSDATAVQFSSVRSIVLWVGPLPVACAAVKPVSRLSAIAALPMGNSVVYAQSSPLDQPARALQVAGTSTPGYVAVRNAPVNPYTSTTQSASNSACSSTGNLYNPSGATANTAVGNGLVSTVSCDSSRTLFGNNSILGRSVTIETNASPSSAQQCGTLFLASQPSGARMLQARVSFPSYAPVTGDIYLTQWAYSGQTNLTATDYRLNGYSDTQLLINVKRASSTSNHNFHVHVNRIPPYPYNKSPCQELYAGGHYNPLEVNISTVSGYLSACSPGAELRCEVGDLSGKTGQLNVDGSPRFSTVAFLPLEGPYSIMGRSIVIHDPNSGAGRLACGNIVDARSTDAYVTFVTPVDPIDHPRFLQLAQAALNVNQSVLQYVHSYSDTATQCTLLSVNVLANDAAASKSLASRLRQVDLGAYTHQPKCDAFSDDASGLVHSLAIVLLCLCATLLL
ncbi:uncharacterized protein LOC135804536 isoform X2 [Sycon ciliatum]|uniref:uncharacterized protein LOC135804536 isoform X2 n=1 Tax=Sycon ciliatum TaxID=27933 RepID=UPI0031F5F250